MAVKLPISKKVFFLSTFLNLHGSWTSIDCWSDGIAVRTSFFIYTYTASPFSATSAHLSMNLPPSPTSKISRAGRSMLVGAFCNEGRETFLHCCLASQQRLRRSLFFSISDAVSGRKRKACDNVFTALGYDSLQSRHVAHEDDQERARELQVSEAKGRILACLPGNEFKSNHYRWSNLKGLPIPGGRFWLLKVQYST